MPESIFRLHAMAADHGDCLWIEYGSAAAPSRILVDAGTPGTSDRVKAALNLVRGPEPSHELLLLTHIDADHIGGALALLDSTEFAAQFKEVWFNGRRHLNEAQVLEHFGAVQAERLTRRLLDRQVRWNAAANGGPLMRRPGQPLPSFAVGEALLTVLSPTPDQLLKLIKSWDQEIKKADLDPSQPLLPAKMPPSAYEVFGTRVNVMALAEVTEIEDGAPANGSSIATLLEFAGKKILLGADAHPAVLLAGIEQLSPNEPLRVDIFKLPHHGSAANVTRALLNKVSAKTVVVSSNGAYFKHPDQTAIARVLVRYQSEGVHLVFNYKTEFNQMWDSDELREQWNYTTEYGTGADGAKVSLLPVT